MPLEKGRKGEVMAKNSKNIYQREDGQYEDVETGLLKIKPHIKREENPPTRQNSLTVGEWLSIWLETHARPNIKMTSYSVYRARFEKHVIPVVGDRMVCDIGREEMEYLRDVILSKGCTDNTAQAVCRLLHAAFETAKDRGLIDTAPPVPYVRKSMKTPPRFLTESEQRRLESSLNLEKKEDIAIYLSLYTGLRVGECCALKWSDVDLHEKCLYIHHTVQRVRQYGADQKTALLYLDAKTANSVRQIPLIEAVLSPLASAAERDAPNPEDFVFGSGDGPAEPRRMQRNIENISRKAGLERVHFHTLRHTFATRCMEKQIDIKSLSELLGHSSVKNTLDWYCHSSISQKRRMLERLVQVS